jgi:hypothetical protein
MTSLEFWQQAFLKSLRAGHCVEDAEDTARYALNRYIELVAKQPVDSSLDRP